jgi:SAM-dependent methyltransferase
MPSAFKLIRRIRESARANGTADSIAQFENLSTHAQYCVPYEKTAEHVRRGDRVLDWGCGNGHFSLLLEALGAQVTGYSFESPPRAMERSPNFRFVAGTVGEPSELPFPSASFDAAVSMGVLEHVWETGGDERASLAALARVVRPGGHFLTFHFPNRTGWIEPVVKALRLKKHFHERKYDERQIRTLWNEAGFTILDMGRYNTLPHAELRLLPTFAKDSELFARAYGLADRAIAAIIPQVSMNFYVIAQRRA